MHDASLVVELELTCHRPSDTCTDLLPYSLCAVVDQRVLILYSENFMHVCMRRIMKLKPTGLLCIIKERSTCLVMAKKCPR